ncbi:phytoene desaturase family protein [Nocardioides aestuarii]|uniref:Phytoene desaturase family protein n=1 Tax=Nocardioides aestuarii TaxID=252231 RepID=A0ABW4TI66_9ACTN
MTVVGGGHNALVAAAYLARAGLSVLVLERLERRGGVAGATDLFPGHGARFARHSSFLSPLPLGVVEELGLDLPRAPLPTPCAPPPGHDDHEAWRAFHTDVAGVIDRVAPTLLEPLPVERAVREAVDDAAWADLVLRPIGETVERRFTDDTVRGLVAADALVGTSASLHDPSLAPNRTFLHRHLGRRPGADQPLPLGGRGADLLAQAAVEAGAEILTSAGVSRIEGGDEGAEVTWHDATGGHTVGSRHVLSDVAPWVLRILLGDGEDPDSKPAGSQLAITMLVERLPSLRSGDDPATALAAGLPVGGYAGLEQARLDAAEGRLPAALPGELRSPSLLETGVLGDESADGRHLLTFLGHHTPAALFAHDRDARRDEAVERALASIDELLTEPVRSLLATDHDGSPCLTAAVPQDVEDDLATPGGQLFHGDLEWPWAPNRARLETPAQRWGVQTDVGSVLVCGSGARRAGVVAGVGGHNAAQAVLEGR